MGRILFINGSPNRDGHTAQLADRLLRGNVYATLSLTDYVIGCYGQSLPYDQMEDIIQAIEKADTVVLGSPVYWHNLCGSVRNFLDRCYGTVPEEAWQGKQLYLIYQGAAPERWMTEAGEYTIKRFADLYGLTYRGMITNDKEARVLADTVGI